MQLIRHFVNDYQCEAQIDILKVAIFQRISYTLLNYLKINKNTAIRGLLQLHSRATRYII
mgnify:CR=1 FL=1|jgi:hypothetical protein